VRVERVMLSTHAVEATTGSEQRRDIHVGTHLHTDTPGCQCRLLKSVAKMLSLYLSPRCERIYMHTCTHTHTNTLTHTHTHTHFFCHEDR